MVFQAKWQLRIIPLRIIFLEQNDYFYWKHVYSTMTYEYCDAVDNNIRVPRLFKV